MPEISQETPEDPSNDIVVTGGVEKPKIEHHDSGGNAGTAIKDGVKGGIFGGISGIVTPISRWLTTEVIDGTRRGDLTPDMVGRVRSHEAAKSEGKVTNASIFNVASGMAKDAIADRAIGLLPGANIAQIAINGPGSAIGDEEKFKTAHKDLIKDMAAKDVPGYEYQKVIIDKKEQEIYVDASGTARQPTATPITYRPSGSEAKEITANLRDKAKQDVFDVVQSKTPEQDTELIESIAADSELTSQEKEKLYRDDNKKREAEGVSGYEQQVQTAIKPEQKMANTNIAASPEPATAFD